MEKVTIKALNSANLRMDNSVDTAKVYDISCNVNIDSGNTVTSVESGSVLKDGIEVATFSSGGTDNLQIGYNSVKQEEQCAIINVVNEFISSVREKTAGNSLIDSINTL